MARSVLISSFITEHISKVYSHSCDGSVGVGAEALYTSVLGDLVRAWSSTVIELRDRVERPVDVVVEG